MILALDADSDKLVHFWVDPRDGGVLLVALQSARIAQILETADGVRVCVKIDVYLTTTYIYIEHNIYTTYITYTLETTYNRTRKYHHTFAHEKV